MTRQEKLHLRQKVINYKLSGHTYNEVAKKFGYSLGYVFSIMKQFKDALPEDLLPSLSNPEVIITVDRETKITIIKDGEGHSVILAEDIKEE